MKRILFVLLMYFPLFSFAQQSFELLQWADNATKERDYQASCYFYKEYIEQGYPLNASVCLHYADALRLSYLYTEAKQMFEKGISLDTAGDYPEMYFLLALTKKNEAKYDEALELLHTYQRKKKADNSLYAKRLPIEINACLKATELIEDTLPVYVEQLYNGINTPHSEFNALQLGDTALYYSALHPITIADNTTIIENFYFSRIFATQFEVNGFSEPKPISKKINDPTYNNANFCFNYDQSKLYFCRTQNGHKTNIWVSELKKGKWQKPKLLPSSINATGSNNTQPFLVHIDDENDILYFVSDRPNGVGELDIWYAVVINGHIGDAINLGSNINTPGNEITPFYYQATQTLYFSSDWHGGLGGYDIFKAKGSMSAWKDPENMGFPFNSPGNDIYFTINEVDTDGYFTSNRKAAYAVNDATCCNDVFLYEWESKTKKYKVDTLLVKDTANIPFLLTHILPINLYFHNDEPNPRSMDTTTYKNYKQTLDEYIALQSLYRDEYAMGLEGKDKEDAIAQIDNFFAHYVLKGYNLLEQFTSLLLKDLQNGKSVNITVSGFASPLFSNEYNNNLSLRRIESLRNYLKEYNQGIFIPYMDGSKENQLHIVNVPKGKTMANEYVSDNPNDKRNSIYSMAAALERRIQIIGYEEDTLFSGRNRYYLSVPDTTLFFKADPTITHYITYIQIKNTDKDSLSLSLLPPDSKLFECQIEKAHLAPNESTFIKVSFTERAFRYLPTLLLHLNIKTTSLEKEMIIKCVMKN